MITHTVPTLHTWSTDAVPQRQRLDYWISAICEGFLEMAATSPAQASGFDGTLTSAPLGPIGLHRVCSSAQDVYRTRSAIARSRAHCFYLLCKTDSAWCAGQDRGVERLLPGDLVLIDTRRCYEFHFPERADTVSLELPIGWVEAWLTQPAEQAGRRIDGQSGWGAALSAYARQLTPEVALQPPLPAPLMADQLGALLAIATEGRPAAPATFSSSDPLTVRTLDLIRERYAEPGLVAASVAASLGVSERTLHRVLARGGHTFAGVLTDARMAVARRLLGEPRHDRLTVAEIGRRVGLSDASHFIRQCRRHLGATPATLRRQR